MTTPLHLHSLSTTTCKWKDMKQTWKYASMGEISQWLWLLLSNQLAKHRARLSGKWHPMNSGVSKVWLKKQLLRAVAFNCSGRVWQTRNLLLRRREYIGRNSQVKAEAEAISNRTKVSYYRKEWQSRWEKDQSVLLCDGSSHRGATLSSFLLTTSLKFCNIRNDMTFGYRVYSHHLFNADYEPSLSM